MTQDARGEHERRRAEHSQDLLCHVGLAKTGTACRAPTREAMGGDGDGHEGFFAGSGSGMEGPQTELALVQAVEEGGVAALAFAALATPEGSSLVWSFFVAVGSVWPVS